MIKERAWPAKVMYLLIAAALVISLTIIAVPAQKVSAAVVESEWERVDTPTTEDWLLAPKTDIIDCAVADGGDTAYAIVNNTTGMDGDLLLKSEDGAATWEDITDALEDELGTSESINALIKVATDGEDGEFVAVALDITGAGTVHVFISDDGGSSFEDTGALTAFTVGTFPYGVYELAVSTEADGERDIAIGGTDGANAELWRSTVTGDSAETWEDATDYSGDYPGWDDDGSFTSVAVVDIHFPASWDEDKTILVATATSVDVYLQHGTWGMSPGWNADSIMGIDAVPVVAGSDGVDSTTLRGMTAGISTPLDYSGRNSAGRYAWVNVNYDDPVDGDIGKIFRVKNKSVMEVNQQIENLPYLTNVSYVGYIAEGKAIAGMLGDGLNLDTPCCEGVQVYRNDGVAQMDICCIFWEEACKPPTGMRAMEAFYVSSDKAYAVALGPDADYDESAWSVSFDDGDTWNQLSLIDTWIDYLSDVAKSPDCNKTFLVSVNEATNCDCDSVWLYGEDLPEYGYSEYSEHWIRVWCGELEGPINQYPEWGLLRLNPEETTGDTVYLVDYGTSTVYWSELEGLDCWNRGSASVDEIMDLAVLDEETIFALDSDGEVAMSDDYAIGWHEEEDSEIAPGYTIAVWGDWILVGSADGEVSYSDDGGETFTELDEDVPNASNSKVTVAFDTYFDTNDVIYAATAGGTDNGIYEWVIGESTSWTDLNAEPMEKQLFPQSMWSVQTGDHAGEDLVEVHFTGLVVDSPSNPFTDADNGGVIYASYWGNYKSTTIFTGVARSLEREVTICKTCLVWDFLNEGLGLEVDKEDFEATPDALKICGCLTPDTSSKLFALDDGWSDYDMVDGIDGALWTFEDCYAKKAPEITYPEDGDVIPADPCSCYSVPFTVMWDSLCDACSYDIAFALDEEFDMPITVNNKEDMTYHLEEQDVPAFPVMGGQLGGLSCETTYYIRVRAADASTGQIIHSWWSIPIAITIAPEVGAAEINLVSPEPGATGVALKKVGFSWKLGAEADSFDWVLDNNADLSSPIESKAGLNATAYECTKTLDYSTTYYWQVTAYNEGAALSTSAIGTFTTTAKGEFCCLQCGLCFDTQDELEDHIADAHPAQPATPPWVWVVIAIGAVLVIVVIVLIFRTRRV